MKKLSLLMFTILILGCGTETPVAEEPESVVEEPEPVIEKPEPVIEKPPPVVVEAKHLMPDHVAPPQIEAGSVFDGDVDVDPEPLNRHGIVYRFTEPLNLFLIEISLEGKNLRWRPHGVVTRRFGGKNIGQSIKIAPLFADQSLEYDTEYLIEMYVQGHACNGTWTQIRFRTKPE